MLVTRVKSLDAVIPHLKGELLIIKCIGCREVYFPDKEIDEFIDKVREAFPVIDILTLDYLCNHEFTTQRIEIYKEKIDKADSLLVFSCGIGTQTLAEMLPHKIILTGLDTVKLAGFQGLTPQTYDCEQCGECWLNLTGGICPLTSCSKGLLNGPCGGAKEGKCEISKERDCGWEKIYKRLEELGKLDILRETIKIKNK